MRIKLGARVKTNDGHRAGEVKQVIWDPKSNEVTAFVVSTGGLLGHDALVSRDVLDTAARDDEIELDMSKDELDKLEHFEEDDYVPPPLGWLVPYPYDYPAASVLFATDAPSLLSTAPRTSHEAHEHPDRPTIGKGMRVRDAGGEAIGVVDEIVTDEVSGELRAIVVRDGGHGSRQTREIPADHVEVQEDEVHVIEESTAAGGTTG